MRPVESTSTNPALDFFLIQLAGKYSLARQYKAGQILFTEGDIGNTMLLILHGTVRVMKQSSESSEGRVIATRGTGDFLGEMAIVDASERSATVVAISDCEVLEFSRENYERVIREHPGFATRVLKSLSRKLRESDSFRLLELEENNRLLNGSNQELLRLNSFLDRVIDQSPSAVFVAARNGDIFRMNRAATQMFELGDPESPVPLNFLFADSENLWRQFSASTGWHGQATGLRHGESFPVYASVSSLRGQSDDVLWLVMCQDISELQLLNQTICDIEKYESSKETAIEMAHDVKNYLGIVTGNVELMVARLSEEQKKRCEHSISAIMRTTEEIVQFLENMMVFREEHNTPEAVNLVSLVRTVVRFCQSQSRFLNLDFMVDVAKDFPPSMQLNPDFIRRILVNLLDNAGEALLSSNATEGKITVGLDITPDRQSFLIRVSDNGPGISPELLNKVFKVRFTTKTHGHGIGLISVVKSIQHHGGDITVSSAVGKGTSFLITLPLKE